MPMFPLGLVLVPGGILPLHVFEPRYRQMVIDCLREDGEPEFGQALITHGREAGGGDERAMVGTIARMLQVDALDDGRYTLIAVGTRRIAVNAWLPDDPYPIADVDEWPDDDPDAAGLDEAVRQAHDRVRATLALAAEVEGQAIDTSDTAVSDDPLVATLSPGGHRPDRSGRSLPAARRVRARWSGCDCSTKCSTTSTQC